MKKFGRAGSTFATIMIAAIVLALVGTTGAVAGGLITSKRIKDNTIKSRDVRDGNLTGTDIANGSLSGADVADGSIGAADLGAGAVGASKLGTIVERESEVVVNDGAGNATTASCLAGERVLSGGTNTIGVGTVAGWAVIRSGPSGNGWSAAVRNETGNPHTLVVEVLCLQ
jgi:hypothetical protein